jgi:hypothetical protein
LDIKPDKLHNNCSRLPLVEAAGYLLRGHVVLQSVWMQGGQTKPLQTVIQWRLDTQQVAVIKVVWQSVSGVVPAAVLNQTGRWP